MNSLLLLSFEFGEQVVSSLLLLSFDLESRW